MLGKRLGYNHVPVIINALKLQLSLLHSFKEQQLIPSPTQSKCILFVPLLKTVGVLLNLRESIRDKKGVGNDTPHSGFVKELT